MERTLVRSLPAAALRGLALALLALGLLPAAFGYTAAVSLTAGASNAGLVSGAVIGYTVYGGDKATVITARSTANISDLGGGCYALTTDLTVPDGSTYWVKWDRSDTSTVLGWAPTVANSYPFTLQGNQATLLTRVPAVLPAFPANFSALSIATSGTVAATGGTGGGTVTVGGYAAGQAPDTLLLTHSVGHGMTVGQLLVALQAVGAKVATGSNSWNAATHVLTSTYTFPGDSAPVLTTTTQFPVSQVTAPPVSSATATVGTVLQP